MVGRGKVVVLNLAQEIIFNEKCTCMMVLFGILKNQETTEQKDGDNPYLKDEINIS